MHAPSDRIQAFANVGKYLTDFLSNPAAEHHERARATVALAFHKNGWFTEREVNRALTYWSEALNEDDLASWTKPYVPDQVEPLSVGLILAGNIPLVGFHDILCTILSGHRAIIKPSSVDSVLIEWMMERLVVTTPQANDWFELRNETQRMSDYDAVIATGSNNSARYFEHYFGDVPHIIRKNRTSVAVLDGTESEDQLALFMQDIFDYYGLGCRNVTKVFLPKGYDLNKIFAASLPFVYVMDNKKYANNYAYHRTLMMMQQRHVLENDVLLMAASESLFSPVSVLHYAYYEDIEQVEMELKAQEEQIQCVVSKTGVTFGKAQKPQMNDYADGVDTMHFLRNLKAVKASK
ncbi:MAG: acyl-CoA reductase [Cryomorphaceae bacterium]